jgi:hypothetical protein
MDASEIVEFLKPIIAKHTPFERAGRDYGDSAAQSSDPLTRSWQWLKGTLRQMIHMERDK